jgi:N-acetylglucosaminyl-diphospho-decaprenol L-rhamnosyltransferase
LNQPAEGSAQNASSGAELAVSVVLYNSKEVLPELASSLAEPMAEGFIHVIAVDNASADGSADVFAELLPRATVIRNSANRGYAAASNQAWQVVSTPYWLLLNPDVRTDGGSLRVLVEWMEERPDVGIASPLLRGVDGRTEPVARPLPNLGWRALETLRLHHLLTAEARSRHLLGHYWLGSDWIDGWVPGAAMIARRAAVEEVGLMTERSFIYGEDVEWCWRMQRAGWRVGICRTREFVHVKGASASTIWEQGEVERRETDAELAVVADVKGPIWMRAYAGIVGLGLLIESIHPRRSKDQRRQMRRLARAWLGHIRK